jgi:hypothetical protein
VQVPDLTEPELANIFNDTGIDVSVLPAIARPRELAAALGVTEAALAQDRYRRCGIPYIKLGQRVRYLRADVARFLMNHRNGGGDAA